MIRYKLIYFYFILNSKHFQLCVKITEYKCVMFSNYLQISKISTKACTILQLISGLGTWSMDQI